MSYESASAFPLGWTAMTTELLNLAFNKVAHAGPEFAHLKTDSWTTASQALRMLHPHHLDLSYAPAGSRTNGTRIPRLILKRHAMCICMEGTGSEAAKRHLQ
jgi:hypothetical protein